MGLTLLLTVMRLTRHMALDSQARPRCPSCRQEEEGQEAKSCWREVLVYPLGSMSVFFVSLYSFICSCYRICHMLPYPMRHGRKRESDKDQLEPTRAIIKADKERRTNTCGTESRAKWRLTTKLARPSRRTIAEPLFLRRCGVDRASLKFFELLSG